MEGFKKNPKMQCFKDGGYVTKKEEKRESKEELKKDIAQDKKIVKKAFSIHDTQQHEEKTDLSKLKNGGKTRKCSGGSVRKYKAGGSIKKMADGGLSDELPQDLTDRIARKENFEDREMIAGPLRRGAQKVKDFLGMGAVSDKERAVAKEAGKSGITTGPMGRGIRKGRGAVSEAERRMMEETEAPAYKKGGKAKKGC